MATEKERTEIDEDSMIVVSALRMRHDDQMATGYTGTLYGDAVKVIEQHQAEIDRLRKIAAKYELLAADGDRCAELVANAYDEWDTDIPWFSQLDKAIAECFERTGVKP